jgi:hypothetical protein
MATEINSQIDCEDRNEEYRSYGVALDVNQYRNLNEIQAAYTNHILPSFQRVSPRGARSVTITKSQHTWAFVLQAYV